MGSPYRERPRYLVCPRCGEMLDRAFEGVSTCPRCEGLWIGPATLDAAFGNPRWPGGQALWWRNAIDCPECAFEGKQTLMSARMSSDVIVDQCGEHGVWLDRGELGRLMGGAVDELEALRERLAVMAPDLEQLVSRREQWRADIETRRKAALDYRRELEAAHRRRSTTPPAPVAAGGSGEAPRWTVKRRAELVTQRAQASAELARLEGQLGALREHIQELERELGGARQRATALAHELDATRGKLRLIDDELDQAR
jgi:Zn-finger nucleic acid-binding protein